MAFTFISHGLRRLQLASDDGHRFTFDVVYNGSDRQIAVGGIHWTADRQPPDSSIIIENASHFASMCAQEFGLL